MFVAYFFIYLYYKEYIRTYKRTLQLLLYIWTIGKTESTVIQIQPLRTSISSSHKKQKITDHKENHL